MKECLFEVKFLHLDFKDSMSQKTIKDNCNMYIYGIHQILMNRLNDDRRIPVSGSTDS